MEEQHDNNEELNQEEETPKKKSNTGAIVVLIICLVLALGGNAYLFLELDKANGLVAEQIAKDSLQASLQDTIRQLEEEIAAYENTVAMYNDQFEQERADMQYQIDELKDKLARAKSAVYSGNPAKLAIAKKELEEIKGKNEIISAQLAEAKDQLKIAEEKNVMYEESLVEVREEADSVIAAKQDLEKRVKKEAALKLGATVAIPTREKRGSNIEELKASRVEKISLEFLILANALAEPGKRDIFIIITGPGKVVLTNNNSTLTSSSELYSLKKTIDYKGEEENVRLSFKQKAEYKPGRYTVRVIIDGNLAGRTEFTLR